MPSPADVVAAARGELGTPWVHQARLPGVALDCAGLVIVTAKRLGLLPEAWEIADYTREPDGTLLQVCDAHMDRIDRLELGAVVVVSIVNTPQHLGIVGDYRHGGHSLIHSARSGRTSQVIETRLMFSQIMKLKAAYRLRGVA